MLSAFKEASVGWLLSALPAHVLFACMHATCVRSEGTTEPDFWLIHTVLGASTFGIFHGVAYVQHKGLVD